MEEINIEELQKHLEEKIIALDRQRKEQAEQFNKEQAERATLAEMERKQQIVAYEEAEKKRLAKKLEEEEAEKKRVQEAQRKQIALDNSLAAAEEARKLQEAKLAWLVAEINKQEFVEEQHRLSMKTATIAPKDNSIAEFSVENPSAPDNKGNAVDGTTGDTQNELMSTHLKHILRQAQSNY